MPIGAALRTLCPWPGKQHQQRGEGLVTTGEDDKGRTWTEQVGRPPRRADAAQRREALAANPDSATSY